MSRNALKVLACVAMLVDHLGILLFPEIRILRYIGRLALPIFAFFLGEGCRYTRSRSRYFFNLFSLGLLCQGVYLAEQLVLGEVNGIYLNILFTLSMSHILCCLFLDVKRAYQTPGRPGFVSRTALFLLTTAVLSLFCCLGPALPFSVTLDYGLPGLLLPLSAVIFSDRKSSSFPSPAAFCSSTSCEEPPCPTPGFPSWHCPFCFSTTDKRASGAANGRSMGFIPSIWFSFTPSSFWLFKIETTKTCRYL